MSFHDPIADLLVRIRNAIKAKMPSVNVPHSSLKAKILQLIKDEGYILDFTTTGEKKKVITIKLKYHKGKISSINGLKQISKPSLRVYANADNLPRVLNNLGVAIISTNNGLLTGKQARVQKLGGEVIAYVW